MSNEGSDFIHLSVATSIGHETSSSNQSDQSTLSNSKHVRMGRGLVKVKRYENEAPRAAKQSPVSPISPASTDGSDTLVNRPSKRRWLPPLRLRNISMSGIPTDKHFAKSVKHGEVKSWIETQAHGRCSTSQEISANRPEVLDITSEASSTPTPSGSETPVDHRNNAAPALRDARDLYHVLGSSHEVTSHKSTSPQSADEEDEDGRALLEALGLGELNTVVEQMDSIEEDHPPVNNPSDCDYEAEGDLVPPMPYVLPQIRPLPPIPLPTSSTECRPEFVSKFVVPPPHDSQDAYAYVFGSSPRASVQSNAPPPPYASRYSAIHSQPTITRNDMEMLQQQLHGMEIPEVAPLVVRRRDDSLAQRQLIAKNR